MFLSTTGSKISLRQIARFVISFCCAFPIGIVVFGLGFGTAVLILLALLHAVGEEAKAGKPWLGLIIANLLGFLAPLVFRWCRKVHPIATLKQELRCGHPWGILCGLMIGTAIGMTMLLRGVLHM